MKKALAILLYFIYLFGAITTAAMADPLPPGQTTIVVSEHSMQGWFFFEETPGGQGELVSGPDTPPLALGSAHLTVSTTTGGMTIQLIDFRATPLNQINYLEYSTYVDQGSPSTVQTISLQFNIDDDLTDGDNSWKGRLVFEPYYTQPIVKGVWQTWGPDVLLSDDGTPNVNDPTTGNWWGTSSPINNRCPIDNPCTWAELLYFFPNIGIRDADYTGVLFKAGSGWPAGFSGYVDAFTIQINDKKITYDFEHNFRDCMNGGWMNSQNPEFRNQGECVSYIASGGRTTAARAIIPVLLPAGGSLVYYSEVSLKRIRRRKNSI